MLDRLWIFILFMSFMFQKIKFDLHMFQQNSYRPKRYLRWIFGDNNRAWKGTDSLILISMLIFAYLGYKSSIAQQFIISKGSRLCPTQRSLIVSFLPVVFIALAEEAHNLLMSVREIKKPLVYTPRVKRLRATVLVLITLFLIIAIKQHLYIFATAVFGLSFFSYMIIILANFINSPIEKIINNSYINDAKKILAENPNRIVIGITGSYGKTSTKQIMAQLLQNGHNVLATPESYNTLMGVVKTIRSSLRPIHDIFIVEMGAKQIGDIKEICDLVKPNIGIITSIGEQHLETFKTLENIKHTKNELFMNLCSGGTAFFNLSDDNIKSLPLREDIHYIGFKVDNDDTNSSIDYMPHIKTIYTASGIQINKKGMSFDVTLPDSSILNFSTKLLGTHNINNLLGTIAIANKIKANMIKIKSQIANINPIEHRLSLKLGVHGETIIDDAFNSNPIGSKNALEVLNKIAGTKKYIITPGMIELGDKMEYYNKQFGIYISEVCDFVVLVGKTQTKPIAMGLSEKNYPTEQIYTASSFKEGYDYLQNIITANDVLLIENDLPDSFIAD